MRRHGLAERIASRQKGYATSTPFSVKVSEAVPHTPTRIRTLDNQHRSARQSRPAVLCVAMAHALFHDAGGVKDSIQGASPAWFPEFLVIAPGAAKKSASADVVLDVRSADLALNDIRSLHDQRSLQDQRSLETVRGVMELMSKMESQSESEISQLSHDVVRL